MSVRIQVSATLSQGWWQLTVNGASEVARLRRVREVIDAAGPNAVVIWPAKLAAALDRVAGADAALAAARRESEESRLAVVDVLLGDGPRPAETDTDIGAALGVSRQRAAQLRATLTRRTARQ